MTLAGMIKEDEDALQCDLAETYHIFNYRELPLRKVALFSAGLREGSRIRLKMAGQNYPLETMLLAMAVDRLTYLLWAKTKDGAKGRNRPSSIADALNGKKAKDGEIMAFSSADDFEKTRKRILKEAG